MPKSAAGIFFTTGEEVLLLKRADGDRTWCLPGGMAERGESAKENAERETEEETGHEVVGKQFAKLEQVEPDGLQFTCFFYKVDEKFECLLSHEHTEWKWVKIDTMGDMDLLPPFKENLGKYLQILRNKSTSFKEWIVANGLQG